MFELDPKERITFFDIRFNPLFSKHFPDISTRSKLLYQKKKDDYGIKTKLEIMQKSRYYKK